MSVLDELRKRGIVKETTTSAMVGANQVKGDGHELLKRRHECITRMSEALKMFGEAYEEFLTPEIQELYCPNCKPYDWSSRRSKDDEQGLKI